MTATGYMILGYAVACCLLWGYALTLWMGHRNIERMEHRKGVGR